MLAELSISNFAIIERLHLKFGPGFNALTGETGAGKSIIIDAMSALLGAKVGAEFVRHGFPAARVEGLFDTGRLNPHACALLRNRLLTAGLIDEGPEAPLGEDGIVVLGREIHAGGRTVARVNGSMVNVATLQEIGQLLIDIHGQTEHQSLLRPATHLELLDQHAGVAAERARLADLVIRLRQVRKDLATLQRDERELARRADLLNFQVEEIERAELVPGEDEELDLERARLMNAERLGTLADTIYSVLIAGAEENEGYGSRGAGRGGRPGPTGGDGAVRDALGQASGLLGELVRLDATLKDQEPVLQTLLDGVEELGRAVRLYRERVEHDPERLLQVEERLSLLHELKRKYAPTIAEIVEFGRQAAAELDTLAHSEERIADLQAEEAALLAEAGTRAAALSQQRQEAGARLARAVEESMRELLMGSIQFATSITRLPDAQGLPAPGPDGAPGIWAFDTRGIDRVEFLISPNPGEPLKPLSKIASGGETSRLMLAMKSILSSADHTATLIFDEIDVGVGGRSGQVVGEKLWSLTDNHQVLCITHLPQIAAFADTHFRIAKQVKDGRATTQVDELAPADRAGEIAAMLGGLPVTASSLENAREIVRHTNQAKALRRGATASELLATAGAASRPPGDSGVPAWPAIKVQ
ncbi:MAG TPA: DNA repair protein RecN [Chloroflexia bacterium]|nr:DNA repair protein RecN [Chloroflexia bacterium]